MKEGKRDEIVQETRLWDESSAVTYTMRKKEGLADYRYFPEPDLPPLVIDPVWMDQIQADCPELPAGRRQRYLDLGLSLDDVMVLTDETDIGDYFDAVMRETQPSAAKAVANWIMGDITAYCKNEKVAWAALSLKPKTLIEMIQLIQSSVISGKIAKQILPELLKGHCRCHPNENLMPGTFLRRRRFWR